MFIDVYMFSLMFHQLVYFGSCYHTEVMPNSFIFLACRESLHLYLTVYLNPYGGMVPGAAAAAATAVTSPNTAAAAFAAAAAIAAANYRSLMQPRSSRPVLAPPGLPPVTSDGGC